MKVLLLDIETAPNEVYTWGLWDQNIAINQIKKPGYTMCWGAQWLDEDSVMFSSLVKDGKRAMLKLIYELLNHADVVVHWNGTDFDIPTLNREFVMMGWSPPSPFIQIDMCRTVRKRFKFASNKLDFVSEQLGLGKKIKTEFDLWLGCMAGDKESWHKMEKYNKRDVNLLVGMYAILAPWATNHPNVGLYDDLPISRCPTCNSEHIVKRGFQYTKTQKYQRYKCEDCGTWSRGRTTELSKEKRSHILVGVS